MIAEQNIKQKWLILTQYYPPELGAPQIRLHALVKQLVKHNKDVSVLTAMPNYPTGVLFSGYKGKFYTKEELDGVVVRRTWIFPATGKSLIGRLLNYFSFTFSSLIATFLIPRPDVIFLESQPLSLGIVVLLMKWLKGVPYIYNVPDLQIDAAQQLGFVNSKRFLRFASRLENCFLRQSWKVSTVTHRFIEHFQLRGIPRFQLSFLPNGADADFLQPYPPKQKLLDRWNLHEKKVFTYVGTHAYYHGLETLISAAAELSDRSDLVFLIVGRGPERERIKKMAKVMNLNNVIFAQSSYKEMPQLYSITYAAVALLRNMEVAKQMRLSKVFPALSCGVPVIYSGFGEAADLIVRNGCGLTSLPEDSVKLASVILELADDPHLREKMSKAGRELIENEYDWSHIISKWLNEISLNTFPS